MCVVVWLFCKSTYVTRSFATPSLGLDALRKEPVNHTEHTTPKVAFAAISTWLSGRAAQLGPFAGIEPNCVDQRDLEPIFDDLAGVRFLGVEIWLQGCPVPTSEPL